ncbi:hypothetical protein P167DRAFT_151372 [Morchella conica CCBAS932]|uniref:Uncharacterized protein n=1 Tax=Morchella conica CCBAS932 TaxID=1392247 RepID=A0A3N4KQ95_9PEZI|nr:hypothetical protein P167DRAFT_151372 [Morchella conica CCBAS932]
MEPPPGRYSVPPRKGSSSSGPPPSPVDAALQKSKSRRLSKEQRKSGYDRIETLTKELTHALKDEMTRRKDSWDVEGDREEEEQWESRKQEIYDGLSELTEEIKRALRDRSKEAVLEMWGKELEERRAQRSSGSKRDGDWDGHGEDGGKSVAGGDG